MNATTRTEKTAKLLMTTRIDGLACEVSDIELDQVRAKYRGVNAAVYAVRFDAGFDRLTGDVVPFNLRVCDADRDEWVSVVDATDPIAWSVAIATARDLETESGERFIADRIQGELERAA